MITTTNFDGPISEEDFERIFGMAETLTLEMVNEAREDMDIEQAIINAEILYGMAELDF